ncbi:hypothetical protein HETIRDRAFT_108673 [Heterobasidion irregulare TC 32-1]|uniref:Uncharacterized protein n=1 Tax=Heterobasidion irregulare (strain TC 32-1) TaxID=747525 RepID=W4JY61_HETIT|nr:uncharacterized protein HETIRDRAFT_108673 [Heterobasidion irregulare TC 32-1]ETW78483.1 hypothetical protein HETIRDRAFT_108673 [Heterobasidion irregulare TC 32-1]
MDINQPSEWGVQSRLLEENKALAIEWSHLSDRMGNVQRMHTDLECSVRPAPRHPATQHPRTLAPRTLVLISSAVDVPTLDVVNARHPEPPVAPIPSNVAHLLDPMYTHAASTRRPPARLIDPVRIHPHTPDTPAIHRPQHLQSLRAELRSCSVDTSARVLHAKHRDHSSVDEEDETQLATEDEERVRRRDELRTVGTDGEAIHKGCRYVVVSYLRSSPAHVPLVFDLSTRPRTASRPLFLSFSPALDLLAQPSRPARPTLSTCLPDPLSLLACSLALVLDPLDIMPTCLCRPCPLRTSSALSRLLLDTPGLPA